MPYYHRAVQRRGYRKMPNNKNMTVNLGKCASKVFGSSRINNVGDIVVLTFAIRFTRAERVCSNTLYSRFHSKLMPNNFRNIQPSDD
jgi:hypothetical protein